MTFFWHDSSSLGFVNNLYDWLVSGPFIFFASKGIFKAARKSPLANYSCRKKRKITLKLLIFIINNKRCCALFRSAECFSMCRMSSSVSGWNPDFEALADLTFSGVPYQNLLGTGRSSQAVPHRTLYAAEALGIDGKDCGDRNREGFLMLFWFLGFMQARERTKFQILNAGEWFSLFLLFIGYWKHVRYF